MFYEKLFFKSCIQYLKQVKYKINKNIKNNFKHGTEKEHVVQ